MCLLKANTEEGGRAVAADEMAHARTVEHRRLHVLLVTAREQEIDHEIDRKATRDRSRVESDDQSTGARTSRLACGRPGLEHGLGGQIASASCRERVGQYVSISVVAVAVEEKKW